MKLLAALMLQPVVMNFSTMIRWAVMVPALFLSIILNAQTPANHWMWSKGGNSIDQPGQYGNKGWPAAGNTPGARENATRWTDANGNLWLFGGNGFAAADAGFLNDLWKFDVASQQWAWVSGNDSADRFGSYGVVGNEAPNQMPGSRQNALGWTDAAGNLWLFGGFGYTHNNTGFLNDLWKFNPASGLWAWMGGSNEIDQRPLYGTMGSPAAGNMPGGRESSVNWIDADGKFWLFGGVGFAATGASFGTLNDIWNYNPATGLWTWVKGSTSIDSYAQFGPVGQAGNNYSPGGRSGSAAFKDASGQVWLFGGFGYSGLGIGYFNDLWRYNPVANQWTFIKGNTTPEQPGVYGNKGGFATANNPGSRYHAAAWVDASGNFWLFGGFGFGSAGNGVLNDMWVYRPASNQWAWVAGSSLPDEPGHYGAQGTSGAAHTPGGRSGAVAWTNSSGKLWLLGGYGFAGADAGKLNDLWQFAPAAQVLPVRFVSVKAGLKGADVLLGWQVAQEQGVLHYQVQASTDGQQFYKIGTVAATGSAHYKFVHPMPAPVVYYRIAAIDVAGTVQWSGVVKLASDKNTGFALVPNPAQEQVKIVADVPVQHVRLRTTHGAIVQEFIPGPGTVISLNLHQLPRGMYVVEATLSNGVTSRQQLVVR